MCRADCSCHHAHPCCRRRTGTTEVVCPVLTGHRRGRSLKMMAAPHFAEYKRAVVCARGEVSAPTLSFCRALRWYSAALSLAGWRRAERERGGGGETLSAAKALPSSLLLFARARLMDDPLARSNTNPNIYSLAIAQDRLALHDAALLWVSRAYARYVLATIQAARHDQNVHLFNHLPSRRLRGHQVQSSPGEGHAL